VRVRIAPGTKEPQRIARGQRHPARVEATTALRRAADGDGSASLRRQVDAARGLPGKGKLERAARLPARVLELQREVRRIAGEYRCHPPRGQAQAKEVVKGMHHGHDAQAGEEKDQRVAETQVVVDGPDEHDHQDQGEEEAGARRDDEDAPLAEDDR
jgi:hypothetical protein